MNSIFLGLLGHSIGYDTETYLFQGWPFGVGYTEDAMLVFVLASRDRRPIPIKVGTVGSGSIQPAERER